MSNILKKIKKTNKKIDKSEAMKTTGEIAIEIAESTPPGEIVAASIAENKQEENK